jgi:hypothetical protein
MSYHFLIATRYYFSYEFGLREIRVIRFRLFVKHDHEFSVLTLSLLS